MKAVVLAYHSHNIFGSDYARNDHVALAADLLSLSDWGARIVPLATIAEALAAGAVSSASSETMVGLSFDDGPIFDVADFTHPDHGPQRGFLNILKDFKQTHPGRQPQLHATSFVIASPRARQAMEAAEDCGYSYLKDWLSEGWWRTASDSGLLEIGNHSWDHVHHAVPEVPIAADARDNFALVDNRPDADHEIRRAADYINARVAGRCRLFAFPFGHSNDYLVGEYLPQFRSEHGMCAAFGTGSRVVAPTDSIWNIPRLVCGYDWKSPEQLRTWLN